MVSDSPASRAPIALLAGGGSAGWVPAPRTEAPARARRPGTARRRLDSGRIPYGYLGLVVIGRQIGLSYADATGFSNGLLTRGSELLRHLQGGDHVLRKVITWAIVIFIVYYLATDPSGAAHALQSAFNGLKSAGNSMSRFVNKL
jgi:hypothetical protein